MKPLDEKRLDETIAKINKRCKVQKSKYIEPPTVKDVLLKTWAQDTEAMADMMIHYDYNTRMWCTIGVNGGALDFFKHAHEAASAEIAYLNSAAEVEK